MSVVRLTGLAIGMCLGRGAWAPSATPAYPVPFRFEGRLDQVQIELQ